ncbi:hypothetical protein GCM10008955_36920 [Deinococcus malanensis]|uniref:Uncharacterized protein n=1 Tax=Deinococcus malanensis TaxID=1706855 RepID=A0ABQ2F0W5_9DEIO|nr:hypothetical protein [Deinococcus malanensis]GGK39707.1 hypothetical protein GCM10008955_36920 [Deinococcus malanensis]
MHLDRTAGVTALNTGLTMIDAAYKAWHSVKPGSGRNHDHGLPKCFIRRWIFVRWMKERVAEYASCPVVGRIPEVEQVTYPIYVHGPLLHLTGDLDPARPTKREDARAISSFRERHIHARFFKVTV